ncbi:hypothetical protein BC830DRAFT_1157635 [Chytriomyces sp. MP71]|nr:hypothetical protein BC830DRAFT_1157635 [Chytriomyces sp. MP71]
MRDRARWHVILHIQRGARRSGLCAQTRRASHGKHAHVLWDAILLRAAGKGREGAILSCSRGHVSENSHEGLLAGDGEGNSGAAGCIGGWNVHSATKVALGDVVTLLDDGFRNLAFWGSLREGQGAGGNYKKDNILQESHCYWGLLLRVEMQESYD